MSIKSLTVSAYRLVAAAIASGSVVACGSGLTGQNGMPHAFTPRPPFLLDLPEGNDDYSQGFRDGCNDYLGISGYGMVQLLEWHKTPGGRRALRVDANKSLKNARYSRGVTDGASYCGPAANSVVGY